MFKLKLSVYILQLGAQNFYYYSVISIDMKNVYNLNESKMLYRLENLKQNFAIIYRKSKF